MIRSLPWIKIFQLSIQSKQREWIEIANIFSCSWKYFNSSRVNALLEESFIIDNKHGHCCQVQEALTISNQSIPPPESQDQLLGFCDRFEWQWLKRPSNFMGFITWLSRIIVRSDPVIWTEPHIYSKCYFKPIANIVIRLETYFLREVQENTF